MVFTPPSWVPSFDENAIPDSIPISQFMLDERYGRSSLLDSKAPFICGISGNRYSAGETKRRVAFLSRALAKEFGWTPNTGSEWDKVITVFAPNTLDSIPLSWAVHELSGISSPANAAYSHSELSYQLIASRSKAIFTSDSLLETVLKAIPRTNIPTSRIYLLHAHGEVSRSKQFKTVDQLIEEGSHLPALEALRWVKGQGAKQCAFLCFSSGTTGLPKGVMVSHKNVIANVLQLSAFEARQRQPGQQNVVLGLLPQSHIYGLVVVCHASVYRGDQVVVLPKFELRGLAESIQRFKINILFIVPPIVISMINNKTLLSKYDLSSVTEVFSGAAPLGVETHTALRHIYPSWHIRQAYGMTETATAISATAHHDSFPGSAGSLLPGVQARIVSIAEGREGEEITACGETGELLLRSPSVTNLGYLNNEKATQDTFATREDGWLRTGDEAMFLENPESKEGHQHLFIVDRIKELIKVKGHQVPPAELEACLLAHSLVADAAVIPIPDPSAGEVPKAFVVLAPHSRGQFFQTHADLAQELDEHVRREKAHYKWLKGGIEFVDVIPKSPSGKILRRVLRTRESQIRARL